jgi:capsular exopolysaccharide synthesis family protein
VEYFYQAMQREAGSATAEASPIEAARQIQQGPVRETPATPHSFVLPPEVDRLFAIAQGEMTKDRVAALEQCRTLRSRLLDGMGIRKKRTLLVTSAAAGEGKTVTSINLAFALSQVESLRVLLVDADLRNPGVARVLGISAERGLRDYLQTPEPIEGLTWKLSPKLSVIPSVGPVEDSAELLHSSAMQRFIEEAKDAYDLVIFDAPPICPIADAQIMSAYLDGVVFCIRASATPIELVSSGVSMVRSKIIGAVLIGAQPSGQRYGYSYSYGGKKSKK